MSVCVWREVECTERLVEERAQHRERERGQRERERVREREKERAFKGFGSDL